MRFVVIVLFSISITISHIVLSASLPPILTICTPEWNDYTETTGEGLYLELFDKVFESAGIDYEVVFMPFSRCLRNVKLGKNVHAATAVYPDPNLMLPVYPLGIDRVSVANSFVGPHYDGLPSLKGKRVAWIRGYQFDSYIEDFPEVHRVEVDSVERALEMLTLGRIDFLLDYQSEIEPVIKRNTWGCEVVLHQNVIMVRKLYLGFGEFQQNKKFVRIWDERMGQLEKSGELKQLYAKYGDMDYQ